MPHQGTIGTIPFIDVDTTAFGIQWRGHAWRRTEECPARSAYGSPEATRRCNCDAFRTSWATSELRNESDAAARATSAWLGPARSSAYGTTPVRESPKPRFGRPLDDRFRAATIGPLATRFTGLAQSRVAGPPTRMQGGDYHDDPSNAPCFRVERADIRLRPDVGSRT